ncbi:hypothetical protein VP01_3540g1 [Puccinia sorghi]|uniref:Uncharacterized protein n=1 Tax=Puccinia sorghi TaxID=27349 RepID=A0A0L6UVF7_9BASI|nr:hypothetical protein VP01_3540g1 [Puccinia sorghi]
MALARQVPKMVPWCFLHSSHYSSRSSQPIHVTSTRLLILKSNMDPQILAKTYFVVLPGRSEKKTDAPWALGMKLDKRMESLLHSGEKLGGPGPNEKWGKDTQKSFNGLAQDGAGKEVEEPMMKLLVSRLINRLKYSISIRKSVEKENKPDIELESMKNDYYSGFLDYKVCQVIKKQATFMVLMEGFRNEEKRRNSNSFHHGVIHDGPAWQKKLSFSFSCHNLQQNCNWAVSMAFACKCFLLNWSYTELIPVVFPWISLQFNCNSLTWLQLGLMSSKWTNKFDHGCKSALSPNRTAKCYGDKMPATGRGVLSVVGYSVEDENPLDGDLLELSGGTKSLEVPGSDLLMQVVIC